MKRFLLISPKNRTTYNFRGDLIRDIQELGYKVTVTGPNQDHIDAIKALGVDFVEIPMNKDGINPIADLRYIIALRKLMYTLKPDATLGYTIKPVIYGGIAAKLAKVKNINSMITGVGFLFTSRSPKAKLLKGIAVGLYTYALKCASHIIFQNNDDRLEFVEKGFATENKTSVVNGSGVNMKHFAPSPYPETITFFMLGRLLHSKGVMEYLKAAKIVKSRHPEVNFNLLGNIAHRMQDAIEESIIMKYVTDGIINLLPETNDVRPAYTECSVFVLPSYREGTPRSVLEAEAMARPVITTDTQGCRNTVIDGYNGFLVPVGDSGAIAAAMERFISDPSLIASMGANSLQLCREKYEVDKVNQDMLSIMQLS